MENMTMILKTLVGSRAHGLDTPESDYDYRGVFTVPTSDILSLGYKEKATSWVEGQGEDATSYELRHFLTLAAHSNPSILEVMVSPVVESTPAGDELRGLFPYVWNSTDVYNAFTGYSHNQQKKMLDNKDNRWNKYGVAYLRVLWMAYELLTKGTMSVRIENKVHLNLLWDIKNKKVKPGEIIDICEEVKLTVKDAYDQNPNKKTDYDKLNEFLLKVRKENW